MSLEINYNSLPSSVTEAQVATIKTNLSYVKNHIELFYKFTSNITCNVNFIYDPSYNAVNFTVSNISTSSFSLNITLSLNWTKSSGVYTNLGTITVNSDNTKNKLYVKLLHFCLIGLSVGKATYGQNTLSEYHKLVSNNNGDTRQYTIDNIMIKTNSVYNLIKSKVDIETSNYNYSLPGLPNEIMAYSSENSGLNDSRTIVYMSDILKNILKDMNKFNSTEPSADLSFIPYPQDKLDGTYSKIDKPLRATVSISKTSTGAVINIINARSRDKVTIKINAKVSIYSMSRITTARSISKRLTKGKNTIKVFLNGVLAGNKIINF